MVTLHKGKHYILHNQNIASESDSQFLSEAEGKKAP